MARHLCSGFFFFLTAVHAVLARVVHGPLPARSRGADEYGRRGWQTRRLSSYSCELLGHFSARGATFPRFYDPLPSLAHAWLHGYMGRMVTLRRRELILKFLRPKAECLWRAPVSEGRRDTTYSNKGPRC